MTSDAKQPANAVKKETLYLVACACLLIGFLGGIVFSVYKSPASAPQGGTAAQGGGQQAPLSPEQTNAMLNLEREVASNPSNGEAWTQLGHLYFDSNQPQKAINAYNRSLSLNPNNADVLTDLGVMYRSNKEPKKAIESFDKAIAVDPKHETARFNRGVVLLNDLKDKEGAIKSWEELVAINPLAAGPNGQPVKEILADLKKGPAKK
ncbi:MAG TPA: tetratricopeptide repeat protein [Desulfurivibrionaceae bacterium]|nr:tetratricopeptide repeat protein [Desulfurivibrionaceae bacterium]